MAATSIKPPVGAPTGLLALFLSEQQSLTAVERFSSYHDGGGNAQEKYYRDLLPLREPVPGEQFAFEVDLDRCSGCKACVTACHSLNGLDEDETWRQVGLLHQPSQARVQQTVTTACHHCADPACANGCPTLAYEKDPVTGIVRHLDDQCMGCQYCILKCPYDVPQYNAKRGIVRKCDMCVGRLREGEAPACVQACPTQAIRIVLVQTEAVRSEPEIHFALPGAPDPAYTLPTTRYISKRETPGLQPVNSHQIRPEHPHMALVFMLVASQLAAGFWIFHVVRNAVNLFLHSPSHISFPLTECIGLGFIFVALGIGPLHLGRPSVAWKSFLGWRKSWLSREVIAFMALAGTSILTVAVSLGAWINAIFPPSHPLRFSLTELKLFALSATALAALGTVYASAMVYRDTPRVLWASRKTLWKFLLSAFLCGGAAYLAVTGRNDLILFLLPPAMLIKLALEARILRHREDEDPNPLWKAAQLMLERFGKIWRLRIVVGFVAGVALPLLLATGVVSATGFKFTVVATGIAFLLVTGELLERYLFFVTGIAPRMPGAR